MRGVVWLSTLKSFSTIFSGEESPSMFGSTMFKRLEYIRKYNDIEDICSLLVKSYRAEFIYIFSMINDLVIHS